MQIEISACRDSNVGDSSMHGDTEKGRRRRRRRTDGAFEVAPWRRPPMVRDFEISVTRVTRDDAVGDAGQIKVLHFP